MELRKRWFWCAITSFVCGLILLSLGIAIPFIISASINSQVKDQLVLDDSNYAYWGQIPGKSGAQILRNFTFYNLVNAHDVIFRNAKPVFYEQGPYVYQERQNYTSMNLSDDKNIAYYDAWIYTTHFEDQDDQQLNTIVNFPAIGAWYQMKNIQPPLNALQTLAALITGFEDLILNSVLASGVQGLVLTSYTRAKQTLLEEIDEEKAQVIWNDHYYGMNNASSLVGWVNAAQEGVFEGSSDFLRDIFSLSIVEMSSILQKLKTTIVGVQDLINGAYCSEIQVCTAKYMTALQWAQQGVTNNPPLAGIEPQPSVIIGNNTGFGYPELGYFYNEYFVKVIETSEEYKGLEFSVDWALKILDHANYTIEDPKWLTDPYVILNKGNMEYLFRTGYQYDESKDEQQLDNIRDRFLLDTNKHARVFWEYVKYVGTEFATQESVGGNTQFETIGAGGAGMLFLQFSQLQNQFLSRIVSELVYNQIESCYEIINKLDQITESQLQAFCNLKEYQDWNQDSITHIVLLCDEPSGSYYTQVIKQTGMTNQQLIQLCDPTEDGFGTIFGQTHEVLYDKYSCTSFNKRCSNYEIALKQWAYSEITLDPPTDWQPSYTASSIYPNLFPQPIEYGWFAQEFKDVIGDVSVFTLDEVKYLLSYDCLYSASMAIKAFIYAQNNQLDQFRSWFLFQEYNQLLHYYRYIMIDIALTGLTTTQSAFDLLFGYQSKLLKDLSQLDPIFGGDPSIDYNVGLSLNITQEQAHQFNRQSIYTGKKDMNKVRRYQSLNGQSYINLIRPYFDGNQISYQQINPWQSEIPIDAGTDAMFFHPNVQKNQQLGATVIDLLRTCKINYQSTIDYYGLDVYKFTVDEEFYAINSTFNNNKWVGLVNFTAAMQAPIFNSFRHIYHGDPKLQEFIDVYKEQTPDLKDRQLPNEYDDCYIYIEPITGVSLVALMNIQVNIEFQPDHLFTGSNYAMLPILSIYRNGNWTEDQVNENLGMIKIGLKLSIILFWIGLILGIILIIFALWIYWYRLRKQKQNVQEADGTVYLKL